MSQIGASTSVSVVDQAALPANIRTASKERQQEFQQAKAFERVLIGQMTESMMKTTGMSEDAPAAVKAMKDQLPGLLADALSTSGGLGLAQQMDAAMHPESQAKKTSLSGDISPTLTTPGDAATTVAPAGTTGGLSA